MTWGRNTIICGWYLWRAMKSRKKFSYLVFPYPFARRLVLFSIRTPFYQYRIRLHLSCRWWLLSLCEYPCTSPSFLCFTFCPFLAMLALSADSIVLGILIHGLVSWSWRAKFGATRRLSPSPAVMAISVHFCSGIADKSQNWMQLATGEFPPRLIRILRYKIRMQWPRGPSVWMYQKIEWL